MHPGGPDRLTCRLILRHRTALNIAIDRLFQALKRCVPIHTGHDVTTDMCSRERDRARDNGTVSERGSSSVGGER